VIVVSSTVLGVLATLFGILALGFGWWAAHVKDKESQIDLDERRSALEETLGAQNKDLKDDLAVAEAKIEAGNKAQENLIRLGRKFSEEEIRRIRTEGMTHITSESGRPELSLEERIALANDLADKQHVLEQNQEDLKDHARVEFIALAIPVLNSFLTKLHIAFSEFDDGKHLEFDFEPSEVFHAEIEPLENSVFVHRQILLRKVGSTDVLAAIGYEPPGFGEVIIGHPDLGMRKRHGVLSPALLRVLGPIEFRVEITDVVVSLELNERIRRYWSEEELSWLSNARQQGSEEMRLEILRDLDDLAKKVAVRAYADALK
jgi:hypothetical protein